MEPYVIFGGLSARISVWERASAATGQVNRWADDHLDWFVVIVLVAGLCLRLRLANATYLGLDEAYHSRLAIPGFPQLWRSMHEPTHPPLLIFLLHYWRAFGTSEVWLRMIPVLSGALFPWFVYRWLGVVWSRTAGLLALVVLVFSPILIRLSSVVRGYTLALLATSVALYCLELAIRRGSSRWMWGFAVGLWLGVLAEFATVFFCAAVGLYVLLRWSDSAFTRPAKMVWIASQAGAAGLYAYLLVVQILPLREAFQVYVGNEDLHFAGMFATADDNLWTFFLKGAWAQFSLLFESKRAAIVGLALFVASLVLLWWRPAAARVRRSTAWTLLLTTPFLFAWIAGCTGSYPFGRSRQTIFLSVFIAAGCGLALDFLFRRRALVAVLAALVLVPVWYESMTYNVGLAIPGSRKEVMDNMLDFIRRRIPPGELLLVNPGMNMTLLHYLETYEWRIRWDRGVTYLGDYRMFTGGPFQTFEDLIESLREYRRTFGASEERVWVVCTGYSCGLTPKIRDFMDADWVTGAGSMWGRHALIVGIDGRLDAVPEDWATSESQ